MKKINVTDVILRDAHQSLMATRMTFDDMAPACADLDAAGYWSLECWGGATFDSCIRFLNEDPWERLRKFKKLLPNTRLQMLLRGQNLLGYRHYGDEIVDRFVAKAAENGIDVFRVFDALNDPRNVKRAIDAVKKAGKHAQGTISYTVSPVHTVEAFAKLAADYEALGCDSICIKDMAALIKPQVAYDLVKAIKARVKIPVWLHTHSTTGVTMVSLMKAVEAGVDGVDTSVSALALGTGHNPTESFHEMLEGTGYETGLDIKPILRARDHFKKVLPKYSDFLTKTVGANTDLFISQIPGGMLSNLESQLKQQKAEKRLAEVLAEVPNVRKDAGYPPLVTPSSQIVGTQAVMNVLMGGRYKMMTGEFQDLMLGYYGKNIAEPNPEVVALAQQKSGKAPITCRPADKITETFAEMKAEAAKLPGFNGTDEDVLTYACFPKVAPGFFQTRPEGPKFPTAPKKPGAAAPAPAAANAQVSAGGKITDFVMTVNGQRHVVKVETLG